MISHTTTNGGEKGRKHVRNKPLHFPTAIFFMKTINDRGEGRVPDASAGER